MTDDDVAVVRWYECERKTPHTRDEAARKAKRLTGQQLADGLPFEQCGMQAYPCWWFPTEHWHVGHPPRHARRGKNSLDQRRVASARHHWTRRNEQVSA